MHLAGIIASMAPFTPAMAASKTFNVAGQAADLVTVPPIPTPLQPGVVIDAGNLALREVSSGITEFQIFTVASGD